MATLIKNGTVVNADGQRKADVLFAGETIQKVGSDLPAERHTVIDATGLLVMPGGVDVHTHLDMPFGGTVSADDYRTGTIAAAVGGTTTVIDFVLQSRRHTMAEALETWLSKSDGKACIDFGLHMAVTDLGPGDGSQGLAEMETMVAKGISSLQALHGLPQRADDRRWPDVQGHAQGRHDERALLRARGERPRHRRRRRAHDRRGQDSAPLSRAQPLGQS